MYALVGIVGLMISIYMRPFEWSESLSKLPFLQVCCALAIGGLALDVATKRTRVVSNPLLPLCCFFVFWCIVTLALANASLVARAFQVTISLLLYMLISHSVQTVKAFTRLIVTIFALGLFVAYVGADQGFNPHGCFILPPEDDGTRPVFDGQNCDATGELKQEDAVSLCYEGADDKEVTYMCERQGLFMTSSIEGRVRYLGVLTDPNELALATSLALPIAFALFEIRRTTFRLLLLIFGLGLIALEIVFTQSRGGQLVFGTVLGSYFVRKFGLARGVMVAALMVVPLLFLGGRSGEAADQSSIDRLEAASAAIHLLMAFPIKGGGHTLFTEHHHLTAHNAYLLAAGELGMPGMLTFGCLMFLCIKITTNVLTFEFAPEDQEGPAVQSLAMAMLAAFAGLIIGIFFLSWTYHYVLWIHFGLIGSLYGVMRTKYPNFRVKLTKKEVGAVFVGILVFLVVWSFHIKRKGCW